jgi:hypothetical protein
MQGETKIFRSEVFRNFPLLLLQTWTQRNLERCEVKMLQGRGFDLWVWNRWMKLRRICVESGVACII